MWKHNGDLSIGLFLSLPRLDGVVATGPEAISQTPGQGVGLPSYLKSGPKKKKCCVTDALPPAPIDWSVQPLSFIPAYGAQLRRTYKCSCKSAAGKVTCLQPLRHGGSKLRDRKAPGCFCYVYSLGNQTNNGRQPREGSPEGSTWLLNYPQDPTTSQGKGEVGLHLL